MRPFVQCGSIVGVLLGPVCCSRPAPSNDIDAASDTRTSRLASCDRVATMSVCSEYSGAYLATNEGFLRGSCQKLGGSFASASCPNTAFLGTCTLPTSESRKLYASGGNAYEITRAEKECRETYKGRWDQ
jgi:hypothetical protein